VSISDYIRTKDYIVVVKDPDDLEKLYADLESEGTAPDGTEIFRSAKCTARRPGSRGTIYRLTEWEAGELRNNPLVRSVELVPSELGISAGESFVTQTSSNWDKSVSTSTNMKNWGLLRCVEGQQRTGWGGSGWQGNGVGTASQTGTITLSQTGRNVDAVIIDGDGIVFNHPEYAVNADGTGGSRAVQYNWFQHQAEVGGAGGSTYTYSVSSHATHVAGTVAGNTQGWARSANIYNIYYYAGADGNFNFPFVMDYVREFHRTKSVNPTTGRKNPTITNNSWGMSIFPGEWRFSDITAVTYRGVRYTPSGETTYTGFSGVCTSTERIATLLGFENFGNRITTSGTYDPPGGDIVSFPETWTEEGNQVYLLLVSQPSSTYTVTVQGPATIDIVNNVAVGAFNGRVSLSSEVVIKDGETVLETFTEGPYESVEGGDVETNIVESYTFAGSSVYTIEFNNDIDVSQAENILYAVNLSLTVEDDTVQSPSATVTEIANSLLGGSGLTSSTTPTNGSNDDGFWNLLLPFNVSYFGNTYDRVYVGTNMYLTFGGGSSVYSGLSATTPNLPKIMWTAADRSVQRIYHGVENAATETYTVTNSGASAYTINSSSNPTLTLQRGGTYTFNINASGHPFWIKTSQVTGTGSAYNTGVTNNGTDSGTITFTVPEDAPSTLYYICQFHGSMTGTINVVAGTRTYRIRVEGHTRFNGGVLGSPTMVCEYVFYENTSDQIDLQCGINNAKTTGGGFTTEQLNSWGFIPDQRIPVRVAALDADIEDAIDEGIIYVGAAGNGQWKHDVPGGPDWDNTFEMAVRYPGSVSQPYYYMRGSSPTAVDDLENGDYDIPNICVGAVDSIQIDQKVQFSDCGPGVDIYAPGTFIISSTPSGFNDPRNSTFKVGKSSGTSMASPQVCGVLACALEIYPSMTQEEAKAYILAYAKQGQLAATSGGPTDAQDLQGSENLFLYYYKERQTSGNTFPKINYKPRPSTGSVFPRPRIRRTA
jgi:hypothetical protein